MAAILNNPFPAHGYHGPDYFCDREQETREMKSALINGRNITLIARRKIGKTSLLHHLSQELRNSRPSWKIIYVDLMQTSSLSGLYKELARALFEERKKSKVWNLPDLNILARLRMSLSVDPVTQMPQMNFDLKENQAEPALRNLLNWIAEEKNCLIILDEFQQILTYSEPHVEGWIRGEVQRLAGVRFIFSGSDQHILTEMFTNAGRPFYRSTQSFQLSFIDPALYTEYIESKFKKARRKISKEALDYILSATEGETLAVQLLCNAIFESGSPEITLPIAQQSLQAVIAMSKADYEKVRAVLKPDSVMFAALRAIARYGPVEQINSREFVEASGILNTSSILKSVQSLLKYSLISRRVDAAGRLVYEVDDTIFKLWLNALP